MSGPEWLDQLAEDATLEGSLLDGVVHGSSAVKELVGAMYALFSRLQHKYAGPYGENGYLEDHVAEVRGHALGCVVIVTRNAAGQTQRVVANLRPRPVVLMLAQLLREQLKGASFVDKLVQPRPDESSPGATKNKSLH